MSAELKAMLELNGSGESREGFNRVGGVISNQASSFQSQVRGEVQEKNLGRQ